MFPIFSLIVPVYNSEGTLGRCVESVLGQTFTAYELILVDDGSTDKSAEMCDDYARRDERVKVIHQSNGGPGMARNVGIRNAIGEYITFIDSDDYVEDDHLQNYADNCHKADLIIQGYKRRMGEKVQEVTPQSEVFSHDALDIIRSVSMHAVYGDNWSYNWNKLYRTDIIRKYNIFSPENIPLFEDRLFDLQYYEHIYSFLALSTSSYNYVYRSGSLSRKRSYLPADLLLVADTFEQYVAENGTSKMSEEVFACVARFYIRALSLVFSSQKRSLSCRFSEFIRVHRKLRSSLMIKRYGVKSLRFFSKAMKYYTSRIINNR